MNLHGASASEATHLAHDAVAYGMRGVLYSMAAVMAVGAVASIVGLRRGIHIAGDVSDGATEAAGAAAT